MIQNLKNKNSLKVAVFGAGSIGCYLGGQLVYGGCDATFLGREKFQKEILENGLTLTHFERNILNLNFNDFEFSINPKSISEADIILVTVKSQDTQVAAETIAKYANTEALIISFQNGVSNKAVLKDTLAEHKVLGAVVPFNVTGPGPGKFHCGTEGNLSVESGDERLTALVSAFSKSGQELDIYDDILPVQWGKLLVNLNNALNTLTGGTLRNGLMQRDYRTALAAIISEGLDIVRRANIEPADFGKASADKMIKILRLPNFIYAIIMNKIVKIDASARSSMLDDLEMGRRSEIDYLQGEVVKLAKETGQSAPYNQKILELINQAFLKGVSPNLSGTDLCKELDLK